MKDGKYLVVKAIPLNKDGSKAIPVGTTLTITRGQVFQDGNWISQEWQHDYQQLITDEITYGWKYLRPDNPIVGKSLV